MAHRKGIYASPSPMTFELLTRGGLHAAFSRQHRRARLEGQLVIVQALEKNFRESIDEAGPVTTGGEVGAGAVYCGPSVYRSGHTTASTTRDIRAGIVPHGVREAANLEAHQSTCKLFSSARRLTPSHSARWTDFVCRDSLTYKSSGLTYKSCQGGAKCNVSVLCDWRGTSTVTAEPERRVRAVCHWKWGCRRARQAPRHGFDETQSAPTLRSMGRSGFRP